MQKRGFISKLFMQTLLFILIHEMWNTGVKIGKEYHLVQRLLLQILKYQHQTVPP